MSLSNLTPQNRLEMWLAKIAGEEVEITPKDRFETVLAKIAGDSVEFTPDDRLEYWLNEIAENVTVIEQLNVTENDTYTAPDGKAYSPVVVNVPSVVVEQLNVTANDTYTAPTGKAYSPVVVNVPSDYSTATVTISTTVDTVVFVAYAYEFGDSHISEAAVEVYVDNPVTINAILYKGEASFRCNDAAITALQGNVVGDIGDTFGTISGTCSITFGQL